LIRINLLAEGRRPVIARKAKTRLALGDQDTSVYFLAGGILLGALIAGGQWWMLNSESKSLDDRIRVAQAEVDALRPILEEVADFKAKKEELQRKIDVITELTLLQEGPVHIMDKISRALPELLWLTQMNLRGRRVDLVGTAFNTNAIAAFIENLDKVPEFYEPEPGTVTQDRGVYNFRIAFTFVQEKQPQDEGGGEV
jgi:type IV pilus assembly protein PilN